MYEVSTSFKFVTSPFKSIQNKAAVAIETTLTVLPINSHTGA